MFSLQLRCPRELAEALGADLWDFQPIALSETEEREKVTLLAGFSTEADRDTLLETFATYEPIWRSETTDWIAETQARWPLREIGSRILLCAPWNRDAETRGRVRVVLNPGMASGTGEHPCTQLALQELEQRVHAGARVADVGTGSGILAIAAAQLGAAAVVAIEPDLQAVEAASQNAVFNAKRPLVVAGFADAICDGWADVTVANISGTVLLDIVDELVRITKAGGRLILSGFEIAEASRIRELFSSASLSREQGWACLSIHLD